MGNAIIAVIAPSRRPGGYRTMTETARGLAHKRLDVIHVAVVAPEDAYLYHGSADLVVIEDGSPLSNLWNVGARQAFLSTSPVDILMLCADDIRFRTDGWDEMVRYAFAESEHRLNYVYGRDGVHDQKLGTHGFIHRERYNLFDRFTPPYFDADYPDYWLHQVSAAADVLTYLPDLYTEHVHPIVGKAPVDRIYKDKYMKLGKSAETWQFTSEERRSEVVKIKYENEMKRRASWLSGF
jgi:hypothetical protein